MQDALPDLLLRHRHARALTILVNAALGLALLVLLAQFIWLLLGSRGETAVAAAPAPLAVQPAAPLESLSRWHLFGNPAPLADPRTLAETAPDTTLKLTLRGIFSEDDPKTGRAIIAEENGRNASYAVGADIPGGATLDSVYPDRVMLSRGGALEALRLPQAQSNAAAAPGPLGTAPRPLGASPGSAPMATTGYPIAPVTLPSNVDINAATAKLGMDPRELARQVQVMPVIENGQFVGVRLNAGRNVPLLAKLGLQPDDIVTSVNGIPLDNFSRAQAVADSFSNSTSVSVAVRRNGKIEQLSVSVQ